MVLFTWEGKYALYTLIYVPPTLWGSNYYFHVWKHLRKHVHRGMLSLILSLHVPHTKVNNRYKNRYTSLSKNLLSSVRKGTIFF